MQITSFTDIVNYWLKKDPRHWQLIIKINKLVANPDDTNDPNNPDDPNDPESIPEKPEDIETK